MTQRFLRRKNKYTRNDPLLFRYYIADMCACDHRRSEEGLVKRNKDHGQSQQRLHEWRIIRLKGSPAAYVGHVRAADEDEAIRKAIHEFNIFNPEEQKRLVAQGVS